MELIPLLSTIIFLITLITFIVAIVSYIVFRMKERRKARATTTVPSNQTTRMETTPEKISTPAPPVVKPPNPPSQEMQSPTNPANRSGQQNFAANTQHLGDNEPPQMHMVTPPPLPQMIVPPPPQPTAGPQLTSAQAAFLQSFTGEKPPTKESSIDDSIEIQPVLQPRRFTFPTSGQSTSKKAPSDGDAGGVLSWK